MSTPKKVPMHPGEYVLSSEKGYLYPKDPKKSVPQPVQCTHYLTNQRVISEVRKMGGLAKFGLLAMFGPAAAGAIVADGFMNEDAVAIPVSSVVSAVPYQMYLNKMIKMTYNYGGQINEIYLGLNRKREVENWCNQILGLTYAQQPAQETVDLTQINRELDAIAGGTKYCVECGAVLPERAKFCSECGATQ